jgi:hypothetical protein
VVGNEEVFAAGFDPLDRPLQLVGEGGDDEVFLVGADLDAEAAANLRSDDADLIRAQPEGAGDVVAVPVRCLGRGPDGDATGQRIGGGGDAARLHGHAGDSLRADALLGDDGSVAERRLDFAVVAIPAGADVVSDQVGIELGGIGLHRRFGSDCGRQRFVGDVDRVARVLGLVAGPGDDGGDRFADEANAVAGDRPGRWGRDVVVRTFVLLALLAGAAFAAAAFERTAVLGQLVAGDDGDDAGHRQRGRGVDAGDRGVRVGAADEGDVQHAG